MDILKFTKWFKISSDRYLTLSIENISLFAQEVLKNVNKIRRRSLRKKTWKEAVEMGRMVPGGLGELQVNLLINVYFSLLL